MDNKEILNEFINSGEIENTSFYTRPIIDFVKFLDIKQISCSNVTADIINQYIEERGFRKLPLMRFKTILMKFLKHIGNNTKHEEITTVATVDYYYSFEQLMEEFEAEATSIVEPYLNTLDRFNSCKAILCLEWMELSIQDISEIQMEDVTEDGIRLKGELVHYNESEIEEFLLKYKKIDGYMSVYHDSFRYSEYINDGMFIRTPRKSKEPKFKIYNLIKVMSRDLDMDNALVVESAWLHRLFMEEQSGNLSNINNLTNKQKTNYNQYKAKMKEYMGA